MRIKTYIVNLLESKDRKAYIENLLNPYLNFLDIEFVEAVDGRIMSEDEKKQKFDNEKAYSRYGRYCKPGEIGCTLSHYKCYDLLSHSEYDYALIFEDDINISITFGVIRDLVDKINLLKTNTSSIILLSGGYWYYSIKQKIDLYHKLVNVQDAYFTHSYIVTKLAAQRLLREEKPSILADDWVFIKKQGVAIYAILPHLIDQVAEESFGSLISEGDNRMIIKANLGLVQKVKSYYYGGIKKILAFCGKYEKC